MFRRLMAIAACCLASSAAHAQEPARFGLDSAVSVDVFQGQGAVDDPNIVVDVTAVFRIGNGWLMYVRPWLREGRVPRVANLDNWDKEIYQAALQYERAGRVSTRIEMGYIASPIGLGIMDSRPSVNPTIGPHLSYLQPMPAFENGAPRAGAIASSYPLGGQLTVSNSRWDARAALVSSAPTRSYVINNDGNPQATPVLVTGAGFTPRTGLRIGAAYAGGLYATADELAMPEGRGMRMVNVEGEYAFGYTKVSGEITRTQFEVSAGSATARAWFLQASHTLSPRWFVAARQEGVSAPPSIAVPGLRRTFHMSEATLGYRVSREFTLRTSVVGRKGYTRSDWDQQVGASIVWARRWW